LVTHTRYRITVITHCPGPVHVAVEPPFPTLLLPVPHSYVTFTDLLLYYSGSCLHTRLRSYRLLLLPFTRWIAFILVTRILQLICYAHHTAFVARCTFDCGSGPTHCSATAVGCQLLPHLCVHATFTVGLPVTRCTRCWFTVHTRTAVYTLR